MLFIRSTWSARNIGWMLLSLLFVSSPVFAQSAKGVITGTVVDNGGSALEGAQLKLFPLGIATVTNDRGEFAFPAVPAGSYTISTSFVGFKPSETKVELAVNQTQALQIKLGVASVGEEIVVTRAGAR